MARSGCPHLTVVVAGRQQKGRGRLRRVWLSSEGGLYFTMVIRPEIPTALTSRVNFFAALILAQTLQKMFQIDAKVKWPNDILIGGKKLSGMLSEMEAEADMVTFVNVGLGINVNNDPTPSEPGAVSLKKILGRDISRTRLLAEFLDEFEKRYNVDALHNVIAEWKKYTMTLDQRVRIVTTRETTEGLAVDVDENGALILELADGNRKTVICGDCFQ
jgi:BirA family biotin operon repressor/biotin-[acetyl-CoA-carboxylase] ligase